MNTARSPPVSVLGIAGRSVLPRPMQDTALVKDVWSLLLLPENGSDAFGSWLCGSASFLL